MEDIKQFKIDDFESALHSTNKSRKLSSVIAVGFGVYLLIRFVRILTGDSGYLLDIPIFSIAFIFNLFSASCYGYSKSFFGYTDNKRLLEIVEKLDAKPTALCVRLLTLSMCYPDLRAVSWKKLVAVLPQLNISEAQQVRPYIWLRLYKIMCKASLQEIITVLNIAVLVKDRHVIPYINRILQRKDISEEDRKCLEIKLNELLLHRATV